MADIPEFLVSADIPKLFRNVRDVGRIFRGPTPSIPTNRGSADGQLVSKGAEAYAALDDRGLQESAPMLTRRRARAWRPEVPTTTLTSQKTNDQEMTTRSRRNSGKPKQHHLQLRPVIRMPEIANLVPETDDSVSRPRSRRAVRQRSGDLST